MRHFLHRAWEVLWAGGWRMWERDLQWYADAEKLEQDLRRVALEAGDPENRVANWVHEMRQERRIADDQMISICKRQRVLQVAWLAVMAMIVLLPFVLRLVRR